MAIDLANLLRVGVLASVMGLAACTTASTLATTPSDADPVTANSAILLGNQALEEGRYTEAEGLFLSETAEDRDPILRQQALTGLTLVYLNPNSPLFDLNAAIEIMDRLHGSLGVMPGQRLLFGSLQLLLENTAMLTRQKQSLAKQEDEIATLKARIKGLENALEKLRRISLN